MDDAIKIGIIVQISEFPPLNMTLAQARDLNSALSQLLGSKKPLDDLRETPNPAPLTPGQTPRAPWIDPNIPYITC